jgi:MFS family permease
MSLLDRVVPPRLGRDFRWLLGGNVAANTADGLMIAGGPLLAASLTSDPVQVAAAAAAGQLPWLVFSLPAGALVDRLDRRRLFIAVNLARVLVLAVLTGVIAAGALTVPLLLSLLVALGIAEVFSDNIWATLTPMVVPDPADLGIANARTSASMFIANQLAGPTIAAGLFAAGHALPTSAAAGCLALAAGMIARMTFVEPPAPDQTRPIIGEIVDGLRWLVANPPVRTLVLLITGFNVTFGAAWGVLVLYSDQRLGLSPTGFGLLLSASAVGGIVGTAGYGRLERRFSLATLMRAGLALETLTHLALALTVHAWLAFVVMVAFGAHAGIWGTTSTTIRQRAVPSDMLGRVTGVYLLGMVGSLVVGQTLGGLIARGWGVTAPFWFGFVGSAAMTVLLWRQMGHVAHAGEV